MKARLQNGDNRRESDTKTDNNQTFICNKVELLSDLGPPSQTPRKSAERLEEKSFQEPTKTKVIATSIRKVVSQSKNTKATIEVTAVFTTARPTPFDPPVT